MAELAPARNGQSTCRGSGAPAHREDVYSRTADFFGGAVFFRGAPFGVGGLRASLTTLPAWNRTALLAAIWMASPVCGFRPLRAGRAATLKNAKSRDTDHFPGDEGIENGIYRGLHRLACRIGVGSKVRQLTFDRG